MIKNICLFLFPTLKWSNNRITAHFTDFLFGEWNLFNRQLLLELNDCFFSSHCRYVTIEIPGKRRRKVPQYLADYAVPKKVKHVTEEDEPAEQRSKRTYRTNPTEKKAGLPYKCSGCRARSVSFTTCWQYWQIIPHSRDSQFISIVSAFSFLSWPHTDWSRRRFLYRWVCFVFYSHRIATFTNGR